jgi:phosphoribosylformylglycinamidine synthase PurS subunit
VACHTASRLAAVVRDRQDGVAQTLLSVLVKLGRLEPERESRNRIEFAPMHATVIVELKPSVLDPQGKAIQHSISTLGFEGVEDVRAGKLFRLTLADTGQPREEIERQLRQICERLLANTVIEKFSFTIDD